MILQWHEAQKGPGYYWKFERDCESKGHIIEVYEDGSWGFVGSEQEYLFDPEIHSRYYFVMASPPDIKELLAQHSFSGLRDFQHANNDSKFPEKVEGYWRHSKDPEEQPTSMRRAYVEEVAGFPWPVIWEIPEFDKQEFINRLADVEDELATMSRYRGISMCRINKVSRGCAEYAYGGWRWPEGLIEYIRLGVPPSRAFYAFIMGIEEENCKYLPTYNR